MRTNIVLDEKLVKQAMKIVISAVERSLRLFRM